MAHTPEQVMAWFKVKTADELQQGIRGLQERARFTESFESVVLERDQLREALASSGDPDASASSAGAETGTMQVSELSKLETWTQGAVFDSVDVIDDGTELVILQFERGDPADGRSVPITRKCFEDLKAPAPLALVEEPAPEVSVSEIREGEANDGELLSTDLLVQYRGLSVLVNVDVKGNASYSLKSGKAQKHALFVKALAQPIPSPAGSVPPLAEDEIDPLGPHVYMPVDNYSDGVCHHCDEHLSAAIHRCTHLDVATDANTRCTLRAGHIGPHEEAPTKAASSIPEQPLGIPPARIQQVIQNLRARADQCAASIDPCVRKMFGCHDDVADELESLLTSHASPEIEPK